ncbi:glycogen/starch synthase [Shigella flexneri]
MRVVSTVQRKALCWSRVKCCANCINRSDNAGFTRLFRHVPPFKTGGLADVIGALPAAQIADGVDARVAPGVSRYSSRHSRCTGRDASRYLRWTYHAAFRAFQRRGYLPDRRAASLRPSR